MCHRIGTIVKQQGSTIRAIKVTCRSWGCPDCMHDRRRQLVSEAKEGEPQRFITLTVNPHWFSSPQERAEKLVHAWRIIRRRYLKRWKNQTCEFFAVFERTKLGEPHLHIAQRGGFIPQKWLSAQLEELIGAKVVDIRFIRQVNKVAWYIAKYMGKEPNQFGTLKRYWRSKRYLKMSKAEKKRLRNAGAVFYMLDWHFKAYGKWVKSLYPDAEITEKRGSWEMAWPPDKPPPLCVTVEPLSAAA